MKKTLAIILTLVIAMTLLCACGGTQPEPKAEPFKVGSDAVEATAENASAYDPTYTINLRIVGANEDELFNGTVKLTSPTMWCSEFVMAVVTAKNIEQTGLEVGYITAMGGYEANAAENLFWLYTLNGEDAAFGCDKLQLREGDYIEFAYKAFEY